MAKQNKLNEPRHSGSRNRRRSDSHRTLRSDQDTEGQNASERNPGQRPSKPRPGRRPQRDSQAGQRSRPARTGRTPSAPQQTRGSRGDVVTPESLDGRLRVIPLGGVAEIGKSMLVVEHDGDLIIIDAGGKFPEEWERGIDLIIPDIRYVKNRLGKFRGIVITHGHEDHIGALPYVVPQLDGAGKVPIYGSPLAFGFAENKLREDRLDDKVDLHPVEAGERVRLGNLEVEFINVTHTIPASYAIAVHSP